MIERGRLREGPPFSYGIGPGALALSTGTSDRSSARLNPVCFIGASSVDPYPA
ncbi:MAG: hypothetical protein JWO65_359, partial [Sphingomonas bacterium]|nr:hypothetical protein [Sphingomonas bacterium]